MAPGTPGIIAVSQGNSSYSFPACGSLAVFDDTVPRTHTAPAHPAAVYHDYESIALANGGKSIYAQSAISSQDFFSLTVSPAGMTFDTFRSPVGGLGYQLHYDAGNGLRCSDGGRVTNATDGSTRAPKSQDGKIRCAPTPPWSPASSSPSTDTPPLRLASPHLGTQRQRNDSAI